jgi:hypothetical protein
MLGKMDTAIIVSNTTPFHPNANYHHCHFAVGVLDVADLMSKVAFSKEELYKDVFSTPERNVVVVHCTLDNVSRSPTMLASHCHEFLLRRGMTTNPKSCG